MTFAPSVGDVVVIEEIEYGSRDVIGLRGTVRAIDGAVFVVSTPFTPTQAVDVRATRVRPA